jgi:hypothetical protein
LGCKAFFLEVPTLKTLGSQFKRENACQRGSQRTAKAINSVEPIRFVIGWGKKRSNLKKTPEQSKKLTQKSRKAMPKF